jgi:hypothetical protein
MVVMARDRDVLVLEPNVFRDLAWAGQRLSRGSGSISGTTLTIASPEVALDTADVAAGHVAVVGGTPYEVVARLSSTQLTISRLRERVTDAAIPPTGATNQETSITTFRPQIALVESQVLRMAGFEPDGSERPGRLPSSAVRVDAELTRLVCLGALAVIWSAASGLLGERSAGWSRAEWYRRRFEEERTRVSVAVDAGGDGVIEARRALRSVSMIRG